MSEFSFRIAFICVFCFLSVMRFYYKIRSGVSREGLYNSKEPIGFIVYRSVVGVPLLLAVVLYCFFPGQCRWGYASLPPSLRVAGLVLAASGLALLLWVHRVLGGNFSTGPSPKRDNVIITDGP